MSTPHRPLPREPFGPTRRGREKRSGAPKSSRTPFRWRDVAAFAALLLAAFYLWEWLAEGEAIGVAFLLLPLFFLFSVPVIAGASRFETRFDLAGLMALGLLLRFFSSVFRLSQAADAGLYGTVGDALAENYRHLNFGVDPLKPVPGTGGMRILAGVVSLFANGNLFAKMLVFTLVAFFACVLLYKAFVTALPNGDHHRYALLIFLWPSLCFWPSSLGKESWMMLSLGIGALGAARVLVRRAGGYPLVVLGTMCGFLVRPHIALLWLVAFVLALLIGRRVDDRARPGLTPASVGKVFGLVLLLVVGGLLANRAANYLNVDDFSQSSIETRLDENAGLTDEGGSTFTPADPTTPTGYVIAGVTVIFRPFLNEANQATQILAALEAMFLFGLIVFSWRRLASILPRLRREPYVAAALFYILMFVFAFGTIGNFGILSRQRVQVLPFVFVLLCVSLPVRPSRKRQAENTVTRSR